MNCGISTEDLSYRKYIPVLDTCMAYVDAGDAIALRAFLCLCDR
jgi:hypothetical protein